MTRHRAKDRYTDDDSEGSRMAGGCVLAAAGIGVGAAVFAYSQDVFVIVVWAVGFVLLYRAAKHVPDTPNPAPPSVPERGPEAKPQVDIVRDPDHHNRWIVRNRKTGTS